MDININLEELQKGVAKIMKATVLLLSTDIKVVNNSTNNPSSNIDIRISSYLSENLKLLLSIPVLSEEDTSCYNNLLTSKLIWVIDPLDGTLNMLTQNIPYCISIALLDTSNMQAILTCNYIPCKNEVYHAINNKGAFINDRPVLLKNYSQEIISYGLPGDAINNIDFHTSHFRSVIKKGLVLRQTGSAVHDVLMTALGQYHCFYEFGLYLWDFIGADLVAKESGCASVWRKSLMYSDCDLRYDYIVAINNDQLEKMKKILDYD